MADRGGRRARKGATRQLTAWRRRLELRRQVRDREATIPGAVRPYALATPADPDAVLDQSEPQGDGAGWHMPYWATPWASGLFLAEVVLARPDAVRGRRVLELGCGLGTTAAATLQAQDGSGSLLAADVFAEALAYCRYNTLRNAGVACRTLLADWRTAEGREALVRAGPFDLLLAADVLYEPEDVTPLLELAPRLLALPAVGPRSVGDRTDPGGAGGLWLAEPGRATSGRFVEAATALGWDGGQVEAERDWPAGGGHARVRVHFLRPR